MGQKVDPVGIRLGIVHDWSSKWFAKGKDFAKYLQQDKFIRDFINDALQNASISKVKIERPAKNVKITICTSRPGVVIGKKGGGVDEIRTKLANKLNLPVHVNIEEIKKAELDAKLVAENIAQQLEKRVMFRRAIKKSTQSVMKSGAVGVRVAVAGRLGGAEIARTEWAIEGRVPLHTFRANIDYATARASTTYGIIGVKVWICRKDTVETKSKPESGFTKQGFDTPASKSRASDKKPKE